MSVSTPSVLPRAQADAPFRPERHRRELFAIWSELVEQPPEWPLDGQGLDRLLRRHPRDGRGLFSRAELIAGLRDLVEAGELRLDAEAVVALERRVRLRPVRTQSGVTPLTVLTQPYPCPGRCVFCPNDVRMPKSYLRDEPGAQRAAANGFDPYLQTWNRLRAFWEIGHPTAKIELIVLGGTWSFHPEPYRVWFVMRCLEALCDFGEGVDRRAEARAAARPDFAGLPGEVDAAARGGGYNRVVGGMAPRVPGEPPWPALRAAQRRNESAGARCVGLVLETRPDHVDDDEVASLRRLGATKVQLGLQSLDDRVLARNRRDHDVETSRAAIGRLRRAGFKIHAHWMPNLLGSTPDADVRDFARLFDDPALRPDELKIYPCSLVESAELVEHWKSGAWRPYTRDELVRVLVEALAGTPRWCRITRVIRDISSDDILVGNKLTNFREIAERALAASGRRAVDVRAREVRARPLDGEVLVLRETRYDTAVSEERFLEYVTPDDRVAAFLRLGFPRTPAPMSELHGSALVREVHVYGASLPIGTQSGTGAQHRGLGRRLLERAAEHAHLAGHARLSVISAIGTRAYYREQGFVDGELYQHRALQGGAADAG